LWHRRAGDLVVGAGNRRGVALGRLRLRRSAHAAARGGGPRPRRRLHHGGRGRARLWCGRRAWRQHRCGGERATAAAGHGGGMNLTRAQRGKQINTIAWAIVPAGSLFVLFFALPFGVMAALSLLSGNPVSNPNVAFTWRNYMRLVDSDLYFDAL